MSTASQARSFAIDANTERPPSRATGDTVAAGVERRELPTGGDHYRLLVEGIKDYAIFMIDATGHVVSWNEGAERIKGYTATEIVGQHFSRFYPARRAHRVCQGDA